MRRKIPPLQVTLHLFNHVIQLSQLLQSVHSTLFLFLCRTALKVLPILQTPFLVLINELKSSILLGCKGEHVFSEVGLLDSDFLSLSMVLFSQFINYFSIVFHLLRTYAELALLNVYLLFQKLRCLLSRHGKLLRRKVAMTFLQQTVAKVTSFLHTIWNYSKMEQYYFHSMLNSGDIMIDIYQLSIDI